jgi:hypothetical protein
MAAEIAQTKAKSFDPTKLYVEDNQSVTYQGYTTFRRCLQCKAFKSEDDVDGGGSWSNDDRWLKFSSKPYSRLGGDMYFCHPCSILWVKYFTVNLPDKERKARELVGKEWFDRLKKYMSILNEQNRSKIMAATVSQ